MFEKLPVSREHFPRVVIVWLAIKTEPSCEKPGQWLTPPPQNLFSERNPSVAPKNSLCCDICKENFKFQAQSTHKLWPEGALEAGGAGAKTTHLDGLFDLPMHLMQISL